MADPWMYNAASGYYTDWNLGVYVCDHRFYDPHTGRWITRDPIGYNGGQNLYQYCGDRPNGFADPTGYVDPTKVASAAMVAAMAAGDEGPAEQAADRALEDLGGAGHEAAEAATSVVQDACQLVRDGWQNVGRWMSQQEYNKMVNSGLVQASKNAGGKDVTWATSPPNPATYAAAPPGSGFVTFGVPQVNIFPGMDSGAVIIAGGNSLQGRGLPFGMPPFIDLGPWLTGQVIR